MYRWLTATFMTTAMLITGSGAIAEQPTDIDVASAVTQLQDKPIKVLDVREPAEVAAGVIQGALLIPLGQVEKRLPELAEFKDQPIYVVCASGGRAAQAIKLLSKYGFTQLTNIKGGMNAWRKANLPVVTP